MTIADDDGVAAFGDSDLGGLLVGVENDDDVTPLVASCLILQTIGHHTLGGIEKLQMLAHQVGTAQTEGGMVLAQGDEVLVILKHLRILGLVAPVEVVDLIRRLERIVNAFLVA